MFHTLSISPGLPSTGPFDFSLELRWSLSDVLGYLSSWSPVAKAAKEGVDLLDGNFRRQLAGAWGESAGEQEGGGGG